MISESESYNEEDDLQNQIEQIKKRIELRQRSLKEQKPQETFIEDITIEQNQQQSEDSSQSSGCFITRVEEKTQKRLSQEKSQKPVEQKQNLRETRHSKQQVDKDSSNKKEQKTAQNSQKQSNASKPRQEETKDLSKEKSNKTQQKKNKSPSNEQQDDIYIVEKIIDKRKNGNRTEYFVKWVGFPNEQNTWEPHTNLKNVQYMLDSFNKEYDEKKQKEDPKKQQPQEQAKDQAKEHSKEKSKEHSKEKAKEHSKEKAKEQTKEQTKEQAKEQAKEQTKEQVKETKTLKRLGRKETTQRNHNNSQNQNSTSQQKEPEVQVSNSTRTSQKRVLKELSSDVQETSEQIEQINKKVQLNSNKQVTKTKATLNEEGHYSKGDRGLKIIGHKLVDNQILNFEVEWITRENGTKPQQSFISISDLRILDPQLLISYYSQDIINKSSV